MSPTQAQMDAIEFGRHVRQSGWRLGLLVVRSCEPGGSGRPKSTTTRNTNAKISLNEFAKLAGLGRATVQFYYRAWELAALEGLVEHAKNLSPGQEYKLNISKLPEWKCFFDAIKKPIAPQPNQDNIDTSVDVEPHQRSKPNGNSLVQFRVRATVLKEWKKKAEKLGVTVGSIAQAATEAAFLDL